jgi:hypothetical protein
MLNAIFCNITMQHMGNNMLKQVKDAPGNPLYWVCTSCNWAFPALQEANKHSCNGQPPPQPAFRSYTTQQSIS